MRFRLPAKGALLIMNVIIFGFFLFYFFALGITFQDNDSSTRLIIKNIIFKNTSPEWISGDVVIIFGNLNNYLSLKWLNVSLSNKPIINFDILLIIMMLFQIINLLFSVLNMFIKNNVKLGIGIDIVVKLFMVIFVLTTILWIIYLTKEPMPIYSKEGKIVGRGILINYQEHLFWIIFSLTPLIFIAIHSIMNAPLYKK